MSSSFKRTKENFACEHCGHEVTGDGYTNHCPECLWSKHVDVNPGDRSAKCGGLMEPIRIEQQQGAWRIIHRCTLCKTEQPNRLSTHDNTNTVMQVARTAAERIAGAATGVLES